MPYPKKNLLGLQFGRLTVVEETTPNNGSVWICRCECGSIKKVKGGNLVAGNVSSCGCLQRETNVKLGTLLSKKYNYVHGLRSHAAYKLWNNIMTRCYNKNYSRYKDWGGRGITVCKEWHNVKEFIGWCVNNGWNPKLQIDRKDNNGPYCPSNCHFVDAHTNMMNRRNTAKRND